MSYSQSLSQAQAHGRGFIKSTIGQHPTTAAAVMGVLTLLVLILAFAVFHYKDKSKTGFEGMAAAPSGPCPPGMTAVTYKNPGDDGATLIRCVDGGRLPDGSAGCTEAWDPTASAEAQALATVGSYEHDDYGVDRLQDAINSAYDDNIQLTRAQLSDFQLSEAMQGGTP